MASISESKFVEIVSKSFEIEEMNLGKKHSYCTSCLWSGGCGQYLGSTDVYCHLKKDKPEEILNYIKNNSEISQEEKISAFIIMVKNGSFQTINSLLDTGFFVPTMKIEKSSSMFLYLFKILTHDFWEFVFTHIARCNYPKARSAWEKTKTIYQQKYQEICSLMRKMAEIDNSIVKYQDHWGNNLCYLSLFSHDWNLIWFLIDIGVDPSIPNNAGYTILSRLMQTRYKDIFEHLVLDLKVVPSKKDLIKGFHQLNRKHFEMLMKNTKFSLDYVEEEILEIKSQKETKQQYFQEIVESIQRI